LLCARLQLTYCPCHTYLVRSLNAMDLRRIGFADTHLVQGVQRSFVNTASQEWRLLDAGTGLGHEPVGSPQLYLPIATPEILLRAAAVLHLAEPAHGLLHLPLDRATHKVNATFAGAPLSTPAAAVFGVPFGKWHCLSAITCAATCTYGAADISGVLALRAARHWLLMNACTTGLTPCNPYLFLLRYFTVSSGDRLTSRPREAVSTLSLREEVVVASENHRCCFALK